MKSFVSTALKKLFYLAYLNNHFPHLCLLLVCDDARRLTKSHGADMQLLNLIDGADSDPFAVGQGKTVWDKDRWCMNRLCSETITSPPQPHYTLYEFALLTIPVVKI